MSSILWIYLEILGEKVDGGSTKSSQPELRGLLLLFEISTKFNHIHCMHGSSFSFKLVCMIVASTRGNRMLN